MVSNCPRCQIVRGVKLSSLHGWCQIVLFCIMVSNCPRCQIVLCVKLSSLHGRCQIVLGVKLSAVSNCPITLINQLLTGHSLPRKRGLRRLKFFGVTNGSIVRKSLKITFFSVTPFILKLRYEKNRYLFTHLLCIKKI